MEDTGQVQPLNAAAHLHHEAVMGHARVHHALEIVAVLQLGDGLVDQGIGVGSQGGHEVVDLSRIGGTHPVAAVVPADVGGAHIPEGGIGLDIRYGDDRGSEGPQRYGQISQSIKNSLVFHGVFLSKDQYRARYRIRSSSSVKALSASTSISSARVTVLPQVSRAAVIST